VLAAHGERTADADRESAKTTAVDAPLNPVFTTSADATISDPPRPNQRAVALIEPLAENQPPPSRDEIELGPAANGANAGHGFEARRRAEFAKLKRDWPPERIDEAEAYEAFCDAVAVRGLTAVVVAVQNLTLENGGADNLPFLSDALETIGRDP